MRRTPQHFGYPVGPIFLTWRLSRTQGALGPSERDAVSEVLRAADGRDGWMHAAVMMDDHVHALITLSPSRTTREIAQRWKSISAHALTREHGRSSPVWQRNYWDRSVTSSVARAACIDYIRCNPSRRWPGIDVYPWLIGRDV